MPSIGFGNGPADSQLESWQSQTYNRPQNLGGAGRYYKQLLKRLGQGQDVSSFGEFNTIGQQHAANRRDIGDSYLYGGNALIANAGGEQANIMNRMRDTAIAKDYERQGMETTAALSDLRSEAAGGLQNAFDAKQNRILQQEGMALGNRLGYYQAQHPSYLKKSGWDKFMDVGNLLIGGARAASGFRN